MPTVEDIEMPPARARKERSDTDLAQILKTTRPTEEAFRRRNNLVKAAVGFGTQDEVLNALIVLAEMHPEELNEIVRSRRAERDVPEQ